MILGDASCHKRVTGAATSHNVRMCLPGDCAQSGSWPGGLRDDLVSGQEPQEPRADDAGVEVAAESHG